MVVTTERPWTCSTESFNKRVVQWQWLQRPPAPWADLETRRQGTTSLPKSSTKNKQKNEAKPNSTCVFCCCLLPQIKFLSPTQSISGGILYLNLRQPVPLRYSASSPSARIPIKCLLDKVTEIAFKKVKMHQIMCLAQADLDRTFDSGP